MYRSKMLSDASKPTIPPAVVKRPGEQRSLSRSATRALDVLELFGTRRCPLRAVEIGAALDLNPSSTNQMLKTMIGSGHLVFDARKKTYLPSARLTKFSRWIGTLYGPDADVGDLLAEVGQRTGLVATASSPNDLFMQIIDSAIPEGATAERGLRISIFGSAVGSAHLSTLDDAEVMRLATRARLDKARMQALPAHVATVREQGFAQGPSADEQIWSIALPLPAEVFQVPTVLGIAGPYEAVRDDALALLEIARGAILERCSSSAKTGEKG
jgi:DNA-binding IclR family transcriptional regulator